MDERAARASSRTRGNLVGTLAASLVAIAAPAAADSRSFPDRRGDVAPSIDMHRLRIDNAKVVRITVRHRNLVNRERR